MTSKNIAELDWQHLDPTLIAATVQTSATKVDGYYRVVRSEKTSWSSSCSRWLVSLQDLSGEVPAVVDSGVAVDLLPAGFGRVFRTVGDVQVSGDQRLIRVRQLSSAPDQENELLRVRHSLCPASARQWLLLLAIAVKSVRTEPLRRCIEEVLTAPANQGFFEIGASVDCHHHEPGGLLRHCLEMIMVAQQLRAFLSRQDFELCVAASLFHDLGKLRQDDGFRIFSVRHEHRTMEVVGSALGQLEETWGVGAEVLRHAIAPLDPRAEQGGPQSIVRLVVRLADTLTAMTDAAEHAFAGKPGWQAIAKLPTAGGGRTMVRTPTPPTRLIDLPNLAGGLSELLDDPGAKAGKDPNRPSDP